jgi:uncharacterized membrane protein YkoI
MKISPRTAFALAVLAFAAAAHPVHSKPEGDDAHRGSPERSAVRVSLDQAVSLVEKRYKAKVVRTDTRENDGRRMYVLRLLDNRSGRVWTVQVDATTGAIR